MFIQDKYAAGLVLVEPMHPDSTNQPKTEKIEEKH